MIFIFLLLAFQSSFTLGSNEYFELKKFNSDFYFYNAISSGNNLFFGTSIGTLTLEEDGDFRIFREGLIGPVEMVNGELLAGESRYDNYYNYLLPKKYENLASTILFHNKTLFIISKGDLFEFTIKDVNYTLTPSIRSISKKYLGTYEGIYNRYNGVKLEFPTYTNGYIREFDNNTMILWDGLSVIKDGIQKDYFDPDGRGIFFDQQLLGRGRDVIELKHPKYLISSTNGLYEINLEKQEAALLKKSENNIISFIRSESNIFGTTLLFFYDKNHIYQYSVTSNNESIIFSSDETIIDVFSESASVYYILTNTRLLYMHLDLPLKNKVLVDGFSGHTLGKMDDILYITSNEGLSLYHLNKNAFAPNVLKNEFNKLAHNNSNGILELGSINGIYSFNKTGLEELFNSHVQIIPEKDNSNTIFVIITLIFILLIIWTIAWQRRIIEEKLQPIEKNNFQDLVTDYILTDLANVDISAICNHFKISTIALYEKLGDIKPGHIIRKERLKMVRKMRKENLSEKEISRVTGFSVSYLKKI